MFDPIEPRLPGATAYWEHLQKLAEAQALLDALDSTQTSESSWAAFEQSSEWKFISDQINTKLIELSNICLNPATYIKAQSLEKAASLALSASQTRAVLADLLNLPDRMRQACNDRSALTEELRSESGRENEE